MGAAMLIRAESELASQSAKADLNSAVDHVTRRTFESHRCDRTLQGPAKNDHTGVIVRVKGLKLKEMRLQCMRDCNVYVRSRQCMCYYTLHTKTTAEEALWGLRQGGWRLEQYVEEFLKLANQLSWHDAALGACFQLGLDNETIHCDLPVCEYPLIELINLVLYLNGSNFEVEEIKEDSKSRRPAPSGTRHIMPVHASPGTPTYRTNGSDRLPNPKHPHILQSSISFLSPEPPAVARSNPPAAARHSRPPVTAPHSRPPVAAPPERPPVPTPSERRPEPAPPEPPPVLNKIKNDKGKSAT
ncbi:Cell surface antigen I/II [Labeo rohita]|uniref:Cell surface antigen I/II n=1 Tax=Labeo rohita TaxID=84645 RepID=A0ABQ8L4A5_LABRO|nr:Cell surface antigen I/II [Labeo rohita]